MLGWHAESCVPFLARPAPRKLDYMLRLEGLWFKASLGKKSLQDSFSINSWAQWHVSVILMMVGSFLPA
jgi:hypothetical protein